ncbi:uncharacterized protein TrAFT101_006038 [Trichoderma asperellum]|nr:hypothetical protein TrAFT101_006038 [Trichoderma asperellum]
MEHISSSSAGGDTPLLTSCGTNQPYASNGRPIRFAGPQNENLEPEQLHSLWINDKTNATGGALGGANAMHWAPNKQASGSHAPQDTFKLTAGSAPGSALNRFNKSVTEFMLTDGNAMPDPFPRIYCTAAQKGQGQPAPGAVPVINHCNGLA